jgi:hypothetical protein
MELLARSALGAILEFKEVAAMQAQPDRSALVDCRDLMV